VAWTIHDTKICQLRLIDASNEVTYNEEVQSFEFTKPFTLKKQFEQHKKKGDVEAILHYNDKRVTVLFPQDNWYTFELQANMAIHIKNKSHSNYASFVRTKDKLLIAGDLTQAEVITRAQSRQCKAFLPWNFKLYNLDFDFGIMPLDLITGQNEQVETYQINLHQELSHRDSMANHY
jgi:hypothetical protein